MAVLLPEDAILNLLANGNASRQQQIQNQWQQNQQPLHQHAVGLLSQSKSSSDDMYHTSSLYSNNAVPAASTNMITEPSSSSTGSLSAFDNRGSLLIDLSTQMGGLVSQLSKAQRESLRIIPRRQSSALSVSSNMNDKDNGNGSSKSNGGGMNGDFGRVQGEEHYTSSLSIYQQQEQHHQDLNNPHIGIHRTATNSSVGSIHTIGSLSSLGSIGISGVGTGTGGVRGIPTHNQHLQHSYQQPILVTPTFSKASSVTSQTATIYSGGTNNAGDRVGGGGEMGEYIVLPSGQIARRVGSMLEVVPGDLGPFQQQQQQQQKQKMYPNPFQQQQTRLFPQIEAHTTALESETHSASKSQRPPSRSSSLSISSNVGSQSVIFENTQAPPRKMAMSGSASGGLVGDVVGDLNTSRRTSAAISEGSVGEAGGAESIAASLNGSVHGGRRLSVGSVRSVASRQSVMSRVSGTDRRLPEEISQHVAVAGDDPTIEYKRRENTVSGYGEFLENYWEADNQGASSTMNENNMLETIQQQQQLIEQELQSEHRRSQMISQQQRQQMYIYQQQQHQLPIYNSPQLSRPTSSDLSDVHLLRGVRSSSSLRMPLTGGISFISPSFASGSSSPTSSQTIVNQRPSSRLRHSTSVQSLGSNQIQRLHNDMVNHQSGAGMGYTSLSTTQQQRQMLQQCKTSQVYKRASMQDLDNLLVQNKITGAQYIQFREIVRQLHELDDLYFKEKILTEEEYEEQKRELEAGLVL
jgi:hypothetical protein